MQKGRQIRTMKEILETTQLEYDKSSFLIDLVQHDNGQLYIEITQRIHTGQGDKQTIKINPAVLTDIQEALQTLQAKLPKRQVGTPKHLTDTDQSNIVTKYLKGVTIKDLAMQYDKDIDLIEQVIRNKGLTIVDNEVPKMPKRRRTRTRRRTRKN